MNGLTFDMELSRPVKILIGVFVVVVLLVGIVLPISRQQSETKTEISAAKDGYLEALQIAQQYEMLKASSKGKNSVVLQERLFSYVEKVTRRLKLNSKIDYIRPENRTGDDGAVTEVVHVAFKGVTLDEFVRFLYDIEVQKREIYIKAISIKKDSKKNLNTQMTLQKIG